MQALIPFLLFAFVASITPGPTNLLVLGFSARRGLIASLPLVFGACSAAAGVVALAGMGLGTWIGEHSIVASVMSWAGVAWLTLLACKLFTTEARMDPANDSSDDVQGITLWSLAGLQVVNPKVWMMALAVVGVYAAPHTPFHGREWQLAALFLLTAMPSMFAWAILGRGATGLLWKPGRMRRFNQAMALMLLASAWAAVLF